MCIFVGVSCLLSGFDLILFHACTHLRALGRAEWIESLAPAVSISPLQMLQAKPSRQRASRRKGRSMS